MRTKKQIMSLYKFNYKPCFLLAWLRFFTYEELKQLDLLEPFDAALSAKQVKSEKDWDKLVLDYNRENLLAGLCILMRKLFNAMITDNWTMGSVYANDIKTWLYILDDEEFTCDSSLNQDKIINYYNDISKKYAIE